MVFYRFIKKVIKFILYQLPKKWLVMIIFALAMTFGLTQVKAVDYNADYYLQYTNSSNGDVLRITCNEPFYFAADNTNANYWSCYRWGTTDEFVYISFYNNGSVIMSNIGSKQVGPFFSSASQYTNISGRGQVAMYYKDGTLLYTNGPVITTTESSIKNWSFQTLNINGGYLLARNSYGNNNFVLHSNYMENEQLIDLSSNYITVNQDNTVSFSVPKNLLVTSAAIANGRTISFELWYYESVEGGRNITPINLGSYTLASISTANQNAGNTDAQLTAIQDVNNSINQTNNFLQDTNVNTSDKTLPTPTIENSQVVTQIDNAYNDFFSDYLYLFASDLPVTISLYIPDMSTGGIASTINIPSNYVKAYLTSVDIPFINYSLLELIYMVWYVVFAFWFLGFATNLVTILFSGEIMDNKGLRDLTNTYTGVSKNML